MQVESFLSGSVPKLIAQFRLGNRQAADQLVEILYPELRRIAAAKMKRERDEHTWQPTTLVNELYLELLKVKALPGPEDQDQKAAFMSFAAFLMSRLLTRHARPLARKALKVEVDPEFAFSGPGVETMAHLERVLERLAAIDPRFRTVVEMRVFGRYTGQEVAERLGCSRKTADRYWTFASRWLQKELTTRVA